MLTGEVFGQTVVLADTNRIDRGSTEIANEYVNVHAQGLAQEKGTQLAEREYVRQFSGMRYATAEVWAYHADDVRLAVERLDGTPDSGQIWQTTGSKDFRVSLPNSRYVAVMAADLALADGDSRVSDSDSPSPLEVVVAGHLASGEDRLRAAIRDTDPGEKFLDSGVSSTAMSEAKILGFVTGSAEAAWLDEGRSEDEAAKKKQDLLQVAAALAYVPLEETRLGRPGKPVFDYVMKNIASRTFPEDAEKAQEAVNAAGFFDIQARFQQIIDDQRRVNMTWTKEEDPGVWLKKRLGSAHLDPHDERIFWTPEGRIKQPLEGPAHTAYGDWLRDYPNGVGRIIGIEDYVIKTTLSTSRSEGLEAYKAGQSDGLEISAGAK